MSSPLQKIVCLCLLTGYLLGVLPTASAAAPARPKTLALVIGNGLYMSVPALTNPLNDAVDMCAALRELQVEVICRSNIRTKREFKDLIYEFTQKIDRNTHAIFYYAGHAVEVDGTNFLLPVNALIRTKADLSDEALEVNYLMAELESRKPMLNVVILDACRNNPLGKLNTVSASSGLAAQFNAPSNSIVMFATAPGKASSDGSGRNGLFTKNLLAQVKTPNLAVETMLKNVMEGVAKDAKKEGYKQEPWLNSSFTGRFCFGGCDDGSAKLKELEQKEKSISEQISRLEQLRQDLEMREKALNANKMTERQLAEQRAAQEALQKELDQKFLELRDNKAKKSASDDALQVRLNQWKKELEQREKALAATQEKEKQLNEQQEKMDRLQKELEQRAQSLKNAETSGPSGNSQEQRQPTQPAVVVPVF